jgi:hypothetical protein
MKMLNTLFGWVVVKKLNRVLSTPKTIYLYFENYYNSTPFIAMNAIQGGHS